MRTGHPSLSHMTTFVMPVLVQNVLLYATKMRRVCNYVALLKHTLNKNRRFKQLGIMHYRLNGPLDVPVAFIDLRESGILLIETTQIVDAPTFTEHGDLPFLSLKQVQVS